MHKSPSEDLFEAILSEGKDYLDGAVTAKTTENYYLDFKSTEEADYTGRRKLCAQDQKNLAKAISAFGNSEGGVVVWGIKTGSADTDYAVSKSPITNVSNFLSLIEGFTSILTSPPHTSLKNKIIFEDESSDKGYVITHIPRSNRRPFQVINDKDFRYYIRAGSSSLPAPDAFLRSLFGQEPSADVFLTWGVPPVQIEPGGAIVIKIGVILHNGGENIAKNVNGYVLVGGLNMAVEINQNTINDFSYNTNSTNGMKVGFVAKSHFILGVEQEVQPLFVHIKLEKPITPNGIQILALVNGDGQMSHRLDIAVSKERLEYLYDEYIKDQTFAIVENILTKPKPDETSKSS